MALQVDVVADHDQGSLFIFEIDAAGSIGENDRSDAHAPEHSDWECHLFSRISLVQVHAALHCSERDITGLTDYHLPGVADCSGTRESGDLRVRNASRVGKLVGKGAETGTQHQPDLRTKFGLG